MGDHGEKGKNDPLRFLFIVAFMGEVTTGIVGIAIPIYANSLGASPLVLGIIGAAGGIIYTIVPLLSGTLSDRLNRKPFIIASMAGSGAAFLLYTLIRDPFAFIFIKVLESLSSAIFWPAVEALISDYSQGKLEEALGGFNISWGSALVVGPMIGGALISVFSVNAPFLIALVIAILVGVLVQVFVNETPRLSKAYPKGEQQGKGEKVISYSVVIPISAIILFSFNSGIMTSLFPAYATNLGIPAYEVGAIMLVMGASRVIAFHRVESIEARIGKAAIFLIGSSTSVLALLLISSGRATPAFMAGCIVLGLSAGIAYAASISDVLGRWSSSRGYAAGLFESLIGVGYFLGPLVGGLISQYSLNSPYMLGCILSSAVFFLQLALGKDIVRRRR